MKPQYRNQQTDFRRPPQGGISYLGLMLVLKAFVVTVPINEATHESTIAGKTEKSPFAIAILSTPEMALSLMDKVPKVVERAGTRQT